MLKRKLTFLTKYFWDLLDIDYMSISWSINNLATNIRPKFYLPFLRKRAVHSSPTKSDAWGTSRQIYSYMKELAVPFMQCFDRNDNVMKYVLWFNSYKWRYNQTRRCRYDIRVSLFILLVKTGLLRLQPLQKIKLFKTR